MSFSVLNHGILGLNARNLLYVRPYNTARAVAFADNKVKTKAYLSARGVPVARMYARIDNREQLRSFDFSALPDHCVLKPNYGFGGEGILILQGRRNGMFLEQGKTPVSDQRLREHIEDILDGEFSVNGKLDTAFFEKILTSHEGFAPFRPAGLPDIRIVVFNLVHVMAMLRVPTSESGGKANVHMGGLGIGIDIAKGVTTHCYQRGRLITELPHGGSPGGIAIPLWEDLLLIASRIQSITTIGYLAVDLTLDQEQGPVLLEVNARAGLGVQVANLAPLRSRLERVRGLRISSPEKGVRMAQDLFGEKVNWQMMKEQQRPQLGVHETIQIHATGMAMEVPALMGAGFCEKTIFSPDLLRELAEKGGAQAAEGAGEEDEDHDQLYHVRFTLGGKKIQTLVQAGTMPVAGIRAVIGRRDLVDFYIDPAKGSKAEHVGAGGVKVDLRGADRILANADQELLLLKYLKPINVVEERRRLEQDRHYSPLFLYPPLPEGLAELEKKVEEVRTDDSPLGILLRKKKKELQLRLMLLRARGDSAKFSEASHLLFGTPRTSLLASAKSFLKSRIACEVPAAPESLLSAGTAAAMFTQALSSYGLHDWHVSVRAALVADCAVGWKHLYLREGATFSHEHVQSLVAHEIDTHILTAENGEQQPYEIFRRGFAHYLDTQEGLATYHQNRVLSAYHEKRYAPARGILAIAYALDHSFVETRFYLEESLGYTPGKALTKAIELKRGLHDAAEPGCFTKSIVYYRGLRAIEQFVADGGDIARLYIGKVALEDLEIAEQVEGVKPPLLVPRYLRERK